MAAPRPLHGPYRPAASGVTARAVVLLHGYGADGNDLIGLTPYLARALPDTAFYAPDAPEPCEMAAVGRQWFSLSRYDPDQLRRQPHTMGSVHDAMAEGVDAAAPLLDAYLEDVMAREGIGGDRLALLGFSQGCMMALHVGLRRLPPVAAVLGYSGALVGAGDLTGGPRAKPPVMLIHGEDDPVVPFPAQAAAAEALTRAGLTVRTLARPGLEHGIDEMGLVAGMEFLADAFGLAG
jgi:phospholipase/carboxylesterase